MKLWGEIPHLKVVWFELHECGRSVEWGVGCGLEALARGAPAKGYSFVERYIGSASGRLGRQGIGMGKGVRVGQRTLALVPTAI